MAFSDLVESLDLATQTHLGGESITYLAGDGSGSVTLTGIFDEVAIVTDFGEAPADQLEPAISVRIDDLPTDPETDDPTITIRSVDYKVRTCQPDTISGLMRLLLVKAP